jgi:hypothetical protein
MAALLKGLEIVFYIMNRLKIYVDFLQDLPDGKARVNFESSVVALYTLIFQFLAKAIKIYNKQSASRTLQALWKLEEVDKFENECHICATNVEYEAQNCSRSLSKDHEHAIATSFKHFQNQLSELTGFKNNIQKISQEVSKIWTCLSEREKVEILQWVSTIPYEDNHTTAKQGRVENTGLWILNRREYKKWINEDRSVILWLHGIRKYD